MKDSPAVPFQTEAGLPVPAVTAEQMREADRIAVEVFGLGILQMMENAGRNLAENVIDMEGATGREVVVLAGAGGNGGGGLCCARHLHNRGFRVSLILDREASAMRGAAAAQHQILLAAGLGPVNLSEADKTLQKADIVVDALIGYSLRGAPRGRAADLIELCNQHASTVLSLDIPSGLNATTGETIGHAVRPSRTLTLALPKTGLHNIPGDLYLADIGIPPQVYRALGLSIEPLFQVPYWIRLIRPSTETAQNTVIRTRQDSGRIGSSRVQV
jgi:NAD(P)H-hydrate epimerase